MVRIATEEDWREVRNLRIEAFQSHEYAMAGNLGNALDSDEVDWREWCAGPNRAIFLLLDEEQPIGLAAVFKSRKIHPPLYLMGCILSHHTADEGYRGVCFRLDWTGLEAVVFGESL